MFRSCWVSRYLILVLLHTRSSAKEFHLISSHLLKIDDLQFGDDLGLESCVLGNERLLEYI
jgi:hypothetical protein